LKTKEEGWRFVRWGLPQEGEVFEPRRSVLAAFEQLAAVRDAVGKEIEMILDVSCPNFGVQEQPYRPGTFLTDVVPSQPEWEDGHLLPPARLGLGVEFDRGAAKEYPFRMAELPHLRRPDGSVTTW